MNKNGITLISLVITIVVMIIIAGISVAIVKDNGIIDKAEKSAFINDVKTFEEELKIYENSRYTDYMGKYDFSLLQADQNSLTYNNDTDNTKNIYDIISSLKGIRKYDGKFLIVNGGLIFKGSNKKEQVWAEECGLVIIYSGEPSVNISSASKDKVSPGEQITYTIEFNSELIMKDITLENKIEITDENGQSINDKPNILIGTLTGNSNDLIRKVDVTIDTNNLKIGNYKFKIKPGVVTNIDNISNSFDVISDKVFQVSNMPKLISDQTNWTNGNITVTISYYSDASAKEYSLDSVNWQSYTSAIVISSNCTIYARSKNSSGIESEHSNLVINNIDKIAPSAILEAPSSANISPLQSVTIPINIIENDSGIDESSLNNTNIIVEKNGITSANVSISGIGNNRTITIDNIVGEGSFKVRVNGIKDIVGNTMIAGVVSEQIYVTIPIYKVANSSITANSNKTAYGTSSPQKLFDGNTSSDYQNYGCYIYQITFPLHINFILDNPKKIYKMRYFTYGNGNYQPVDFTIQGSNDTTNGSDGTWTNIKTYSGLNVLQANTWGEFIVGSNVAYKAYKMNISKVCNNDNQFLYNEMELYEY